MTKTDKDLITIKALAEELKVSKETVRKRAKELPTDCRQVGANNVTLITSKGAEILRSKLTTASRQVGANIGKDTAKVIDTLQATIESLTTALEREQQLHAMTMRKLDKSENRLRLLTDKQASTANENEELQAQIDRMENASLFQRIFKHWQG